MVYPSGKLIKQGAEAKIYTCQFLGKATVVKERFPKAYRHPDLDASLTAQRTKSEVRSMTRCRQNGIPTPAVYFVDLKKSCIYMEHIEDSFTVKDHIASIQQSCPQDFITPLIPLAEKIGAIIGQMHDSNIIHGDLTTSNMLLRGPADKLNLMLIDFGLGYSERLAEDKGVDLYVLERALLSSHPNTEKMFDVIIESYKKTAGKMTADVIGKFEEVRLRGRKRTMIG